MPAAVAPARPDFFIVGALKCGTTSLHDWLDQHPDVFMAKPKEPHYFGTDIEPAIRDEAAYLALFDGPEAAAARRVGEASPQYLYSRVAAREIKAFAPGADIIIMLRDPVEMMHSLHGQQLFNPFTEDVADFAAALALEPERRDGRRLPRDFRAATYTLMYRDLARLAGQVERYLDAFGRDRVHFVLLDDLARDPRGAFAGVCRFLGVRDDVAPPFRVANPHKRWRSRRLFALTCAPPRPLLALGRAVLPKRGRARLLGRLRDLNLAQRRRPPMDPALRRQLAEEFAPEVARLGALVGRDLSHWSRPDAGG